MFKYLSLIPFGFVNSLNIVGTGDLVMAGCNANPNMLDQLKEMYGDENPNVINLGYGN